MAALNKNIGLSDIKTFVVLAQAGSFTKAGEILNCSRSHISKQLTKLESDLGVSLLVRTTRTQHLTPHGQAFYLRCNQSLQGISQAIEGVLESSESPHGHIKISSVGGHIGEEIIAMLINDFMLEYPDITVELNFSSKRVELIADEFDFVFRMGELLDSTLIARKLTDIEINTFASPGYLAKYPKFNEPKFLSQHRCIAGSMKQWSFINNKTGKNTDVSVDGSLTCKNGRIMVACALSGSGVIRVPTLYCKFEVANGKLVPLFDDWHIKSTPFYLVYAQNKHQPLRNRVFKEFVVENFSTYLR